MEWIIGLMALVLGGFVVFLILRPRLKSTQKLDEYIARRNEELQQSCLIQEEQERQTRQRLQEIADACVEKQRLLGELNESFSEQLLSEQKIKADLQDRISAEADRLSQLLEDKRESLNEFYLEEQANFAEEFQEIINTKNEELAQLIVTYNEQASIVKAAVAANIRAQEIKDQDNFYRLQLSQEDLDEIKKLREVAKVLRDSEPLNKVIYKCYYERPYTDLAGRVVGKKPVSGIYKITNINSEKCYVGQAVNISERWRQHIKRGVGAEAPTKNKLYPAMLAEGVENFRFEVVEICEPKELNAREQFWQNHFGAKEFGYSIK